MTLDSSDSQATLQRSSPRRALTRALELAREAVRLDSTNADPASTIRAYSLSVALLDEVIERRKRGPEHTARSGRSSNAVSREEEINRLKKIVRFHEHSHRAATDRFLSARHLRPENACLEHDVQHSCCAAGT